jgi:hypothetical protein
MYFSNKSDVPEARSLRNRLRADVALEPLFKGVFFALALVNGASSPKKASTMDFQLMDWYGWAPQTGAVRPPVSPVIIQEMYAKIHKRKVFLVKRQKIVAVNAN